ncbi:hypothetical protein O4090_11455 [Dietzia kunjamensis]|uniref:DUF6414 family protein n=1 Tax=Dietzia TaxID=37914 RepID=UPI0022B3401A|nr:MULTISPECIES: hypothetical protein [Dietzia]MCZ4540655.1 hypothetical protein [Dietzia maris]MCZ4656578.1 hypothetical protein [Dietzia kunjamensis]
MSFFRSPVFLDLETLVPLANFHDIEVMTDLSLSERDLGKKSANAGVKMGIPGGPNLEVGGGGNKESEITQSRTVKDHPTSALNRLLDGLVRSGELSSLQEGAIFKRQLVELDREWEISAATDIGSMLEGLVKFMVSNPAAMDAQKIPAEAMSLMAGGSETGGTVVLEADEKDSEGRRIIVLLSAGDLTVKSTIDDLEGDRTVFGVVHEIVPESRQYSLEKVFLSGVSRSVRRAFKTEALLDLATALNRPIGEDDLFVPGPLIVVKAIAVY